jgi:hypothetical protein
VTGRLPAVAADERIEIAAVPDVPGVEVLRIDARARLWRWYHDTYSVAAEFDAFRTTWRYRARVHDGTPGMIGLMEPGEVHVEVRKGQPRDVWRVLLFSPALVEAAARELGAAPSRVHWRTPMVVSRELHARVAAVHRALEGEATGLERAGRMMAVLGELVRDHGDERSPDSGPVERTAGLRLAAVSGMGRFQVLRAFRAATGLPPHAYQLSLRISRAMALIRCGLSLADVAVESGFADQSHLTRRFSAAVGVPPARFRRAVC